MCSVVECGVLTRTIRVVFRSWSTAKAKAACEVDVICSRATCSTLEAHEGAQGIGFLP